MIPLQDLKAAITIERVLGTRQIAASGQCDKCKKPITHIITVSSSETPREAFDWFWYSLATDCNR